MYNNMKRIMAYGAGLLMLAISACSRDIPIEPSYSLNKETKIDQKTRDFLDDSNFTLTRISDELMGGEIKTTLEEENNNIEYLLDPPIFD